MKKSDEDEKVGDEKLRKKSQKKKPNLGEDDDPAGHVGDEPPGDGQTLGMPDARPDWTATLLGESQGLILGFDSYDSIVRLPCND